MEYSMRNLLIVIYMVPLVKFSGKAFCRAEVVGHSPKKPTDIIVKSGIRFSKRSTKSSEIPDQCGFHNFFTPGDGDFPWLALILYKDLGSDGYSISCNGNLISSRRVLTAAHCVKPPGIKLSIDRMLVILGNYDAQRWLDGKVSRNYTVKTYDVHPEAATSPSKWDIAVIALAEEVIFKTFVRPICLWSGSGDLEEIDGMFSGWRKSDGKEILTPKSTQTTLPPVLQEICLRTAYSYSSMKIFCAEYKNGSTNLCSNSAISGVLGTGFMIERKRRWYLRGFFSMATSFSCKLQKNGYLVFIDISQFTDWIRFTMFKEVPTTTSSLNKSCGKSSLNTSVIADGTPVARGYYPWLVALYDVQKLDWQWICSGTLVSAKHVITAAHCVMHYKKKANIEQLFLIAGKYKHHTLINDKVPVISRAETVSIHPDYKLSFSANIAMITLAAVVELDSFIRPICLWSDSTNMTEIVGDNGVIVNLRQDENGETLPTEAKQYSMRIFSEAQCRQSHYALREDNYGRIFCAGNRNSSGPCTVDRGGGFMMYRNGRWTLRGILSMIISDPTKECDLNKYLVFVDVSLFSNWILAIINN